MVGDCTVVFILEFYALIDEMFMLPCTSGGEPVCKKGAFRVCGRSFPGLTQVQKELCCLKELSVSVRYQVPSCLAVQQ